MGKTVNTTKELSTENIIHTLGTALDTLGELATCGVIDEEIVFNAYPVISDALRDVLSNKYLAYVVDDCRTGEYSVYIFDNCNDCRYFLDGINSKCREITIDDFEKLSPYDWANFNKYKVVDGIMVFRDSVD